MSELAYQVAQNSRLPSVMWGRQGYNDVLDVSGLHARVHLRDAGRNVLSSKYFSLSDAADTFGLIDIDFAYEFFPDVGPLTIRDTAARARAEHTWVGKVLNFCRSGNIDTALIEIALNVMQAKETSEFARLSADLNEIELDKLPDVALVSMLRNTFSVRARIACWDGLLNAVEEVLIKRGREPRLLLRGLRK